MNPIAVPYTNTNATYLLKEGLLHYFKTYAVNKEIVLLCIGTDRSTGDSLGPMIGSKMRMYSFLPIHVYGNLDEPVHALNLVETMKEIYRNHVSPYIIAIDACLGRLQNVGMIQIKQGPLKPGAGVKKDLPEVGDIHIVGNVNVGGFMEFFVLQNTRLSVVMKMADVISSSLTQALLEYKTRQLSSIS